MTSKCCCRGVRALGTEIVGGAHTGWAGGWPFSPLASGGLYLLGTRTLNLLQCPVPGARPDVLSVTQPKDEVVRPGFLGPELHAFRVPGHMPGHSDTPTPQPHLHAAHVSLLSGTPGPSWLVSAGQGKAKHYCERPGHACTPAGRGS